MAQDAPMSAPLTIRTPSYSVIDMRRNPTPLPGLMAHAQKRPQTRVKKTQTASVFTWKNVCMAVLCLLLIVYCTVLSRRLWRRLTIMGQMAVDSSSDAPALRPVKGGRQHGEMVPDVPQPIDNDLRVVFERVRRAVDALPALNRDAPPHTVKHADGNNGDSRDDRGQTDGDVRQLDNEVVTAPLQPRQGEQRGGEDEQPAVAPATGLTQSDDLSRIAAQTQADAEEAARIYNDPMPPAKHKAFLFTMDSIKDVIKNAAGGGPAGEIIVRESLEWGLRKLGVDVVVCTSDADFDAKTARADMDQYDMFIFDQWTAFGPGWLPRPFLVGREQRTFILAFFGLLELGHGLRIPSQNILTPFPTISDNRFLGYAIRPRWVPGGGEGSQPAADGAQRMPAKKRQGVIWGKKAEYFSGKEDVLRAIASIAPLHTTASTKFDFPGLVHHGHLTREQWHQLLAESKFLLGLGDPLSGPSALDAVAAGTVFINPVYDTPKEAFFMSQHPYLQQHLGPPYVCDIIIHEVASVERCVRAALDGPELPPVIPRDFTPAAYLERVRDIFSPFLRPR